MAEPQNAIVCRLLGWAQPTDSATAILRSALLASADDITHEGGTPEASAEAIAATIREFLAAHCPTHRGLEEENNRLRNDVDVANMLIDDVVSTTEDAE